MSEDIPADQIEEAAEDARHRAEVELLRRVLPDHDIDWYLETGEYRLKET